MPALEHEKRFDESIKTVSFDLVSSTMSGRQGSNLRPRGPKPRALAI